MSRSKSKTININDRRRLIIIWLYIIYSVIEDRSTGLIEERRKRRREEGREGRIHLPSDLSKKKGYFKLHKKKIIFIKVICSHYFFVSISIL